MEIAGSPAEAALCCGYRTENRELGSVAARAPPLTRFQALFQALPLPESQIHPPLSEDVRLDGLCAPPISTGNKSQRDWVLITCQVPFQKLYGDNSPYPEPALGFRVTVASGIS